MREPGINDIIDRENIQNNNRTFLNAVNKKRKMYWSENIIIISPGRSYFNNEWD